MMIVLTLTKGLIDIYSIVYCDTTSVHFILVRPCPCSNILIYKRWIVCIIINSTNRSNHNIVRNFRFVPIHIFKYYSPLATAYNTIIFSTQSWNILTLTFHTITRNSVTTSYSSKSTFQSKFMSQIFQIFQQMNSTYYKNSFSSLLNKNIRNKSKIIMNLRWN